MAASTTVGHLVDQELQRLWPQVGIERPRLLALSLSLGKLGPAVGVGGAGAGQDQAVVGLEAGPGVLLVLLSVVLGRRGHRSAHRAWPEFETLIRAYTNSRSRLGATGPSISSDP